MDAQSLYEALRDLVEEKTGKPVTGETDDLLSDAASAAMPELEFEREFENQLTGEKVTLVAFAKSTMAASAMMDRAVNSEVKPTGPVTRTYRDA